MILFHWSQKTRFNRCYELSVRFTSGLGNVCRSSNFSSVNTNIIPIKEDQSIKRFKGLPSNMICRPVRRKTAADRAISPSPKFPTRHSKFKPQFLHVTQLPVLSMWILQARCGLLVFQSRYQLYPFKTLFN